MRIIIGLFLFATSFVLVAKEYGGLSASLYEELSSFS